MVKTSILLSLFLMIQFLTSCQKSNEKGNVKNQNWDHIELITRNQKITIYKDEDIASTEKAIYKRISGNGFSAKYKLEKVEKNNFSISKVERDSLYENVFRLITEPTFTNKATTDYAGYILIKLKDRHTTIMCEYESVGQWSNISPDNSKFLKVS